MSESVEKCIDPLSKFFGFERCEHLLQPLRGDAGRPRQFYVEVDIIERLSDLLSCDGAITLDADAQCRDVRVQRMSAETNSPDAILERDSSTREVVHDESAGDRILESVEIELHQFNEMLWRRHR